MDNKPTAKRGHRVRDDAKTTDRLFSLHELHTRHVYAKEIQAEIQCLWGHGNFQLRAEHVAAVLATDAKNLRPGQDLSTRSFEHGGQTIPSPGPWDLNNNMRSIAPFCKHYMIHLANPRNNDTVSLPLRPRLEPSPEGDDVLPANSSFEVPELYSDPDSDSEELLEQELRFTTLEELEDHYPDVDEKAKCLQRDKNVCIFMGTPDPIACHIIPYSWNDTKEHNNATGEVKWGGESLLSFSIDLDALHICNPLELGATDKAWNMVSLDRIEATEGGKAKVTLQFWWMPQIKRRCGKAMDIINTNDGNDWHTLIEELKEFHARGNPSPILGGEMVRLITKSGASLRSGHLIHLQMPEQDATRFKQAMEVQWTSILFTSLSGAAGSPELLCLSDPEDGYESY
ncbi:hypothetical protein FHETE_10617 [Fusarium heterosporum]|uniref:HNH nuclease domain-containing protein n=1 Tax=Fusarium heterosporum TaxID=42747 RepID=A0A8H5WCA4_FUSHE|nr:hypothetical protein FHETE_10617 [Fusarium heterosporum]